MKTIWLLHLSSHCLPSLIWLICLDKTGVLFLLPHPLYVCTPPQTVHLWKGSILKQTGLFFNQCQTDNCKPTQETPKSVLMPQSENRRKTHRCTCLAERKPLPDIKLTTSLLQHFQPTVLQEINICFSSDTTYDIWLWPSK